MGISEQYTISKVAKFSKYKYKKSSKIRIKWKKSERRSVVSDSLWPYEQSMEFSRPEYWSGSTFPSPGDLPNPGIKRISGRFFSSWATREAHKYWSEKPIPSPADLADPGIKSGSPALQADSLPTELSGNQDKTVNKQWNKTVIKQWINSDKWWIIFQYKCAPCNTWGLLILTTYFLGIRDSNPTRIPQFYLAILATRSL